MSAAFTSPSRQFASKSQACVGSPPLKPPVPQTQRFERANPAPQSRVIPHPQRQGATPPIVTAKPQTSGAAAQGVARPNQNNAPPESRIEHPILFQHYFKSVGPRTYAAQVKKATNDNHYLVLTEGRRDKQSGEIRKLRLNIFSEDFEAFFDLLRQAEGFIKANPLPADFVAKRKAFWNKSKQKPGSKRPFTKRSNDTRVAQGAKT